MADKVLICNPSEVMSRFEKFSNVWGDCPNVKNPIKNCSNQWVKDDTTSLYKNMHNNNKTMKKLRHNNFGLNTPNEFVIASTNFVQHQEKHNKNQSKANHSTSKSEEQSPCYSSVADEKRKKALQQQRQMQVDKKNIIKQALSSLDKTQNVNKKIVFSDVNELKNKKGINKNAEVGETKRCQSLFNDNDDDSGSEIDLKLNHQFEGKKGNKLLELQTKFASDARFTLDSRFYESGSDGCENEIFEDISNTDEKHKHLAILESIVKRQIKPLSEIKKNSSKIAEDTILLRFDPSREDHSKYIMKPDEKKLKETTQHVQEKGMKDGRMKKRKINESETTETNKKENKLVSTEKFFTMKEDLKDVLKTDSGTEFSLLKLFGPKEANGSELDSQGSQPMKKLNRNTRNPFKYDSSDSEPEQEKVKEIKKKDNVVIQPISSWKTTFFFADNDCRIQEAKEFLRGPEESENNQEYAEKRKMLKDFIRNKFKNNNRKKSVFKNKLGGKKRKIFAKRKGK